MPIELTQPDALTETNSPRNKVVGRLRRLIHESRLTDGDVLPSERSLAEHLLVHRNTLRRALQFLTDEGVIRRGGSKSWIVAGGVPVSDATAMSHTVGVLTSVSPDHAYAFVPGNDYAIDRGVVSFIQSQGRHALLLNPTRLHSTNDIQALVRQQIVGIIATQEVCGDPAGVALLHQLADAGLRVVGHGDDDGMQRFDRVYSDHEAGARMLTEWLIAQGRRRILRLWTGPRDRYWVRARNRGYESAMRAAGLEVLPERAMKSVSRRPAVPDRDAMEQRAREMAGYLVDQVRSPGVDAVMLYTDYDAFAAAEACRLCGLRVGEDVLIAGYDNVFNSCWERAIDRAVPHVTIEKHNASSGQRLVTLLFDRANGKFDATPQVSVDVPELVVTS